MNFSRTHHLAEISGRKEPFDFIIVGGGATGLGAAVDAATRGHSVALIEMADFAKGTSSRSTKLVHGGVRYLRQGNVSLVLEALRERGRLAKNAPHLVHDLAFVIPSYKWWEGPFYGIGMKVYDQLAGKLGLGPSRMLSREETLAAIPTVETEHLTGGVIYHDGQFDDARLAINLAQTAAAQGALLSNYTRCVALLKEGGLVTGVIARDEESGSEFEIRGRAVINATGVFVDDLRRQDHSQAAAVVAVSQGIHIVLPKEFLPGKAAIMVPKTADGRVLFAVPWHDCVVVGTTDTPLSGYSLEPRALPQEIDFLMEHCARYLTRDPRPEDVLSIYAGLRPLVKSGEAEDTATLSRDHTILVSDSGLITITGGKWTTYRKMAEDVIDQAEMIAGVENRPCRSVDLPIHGWTHQAIPEVHLQMYGSAASDLRDFAAAVPSGNDRIHPDLPLTRAEVAWHARKEMARTVEDVLARRSRSLLLNARASQQAAPAIAAILAAELGKNRAWEEQQVEDYRRLSQGYIFGTPESTRQGS